ncbi:uncharacterized protein FFB20_11706 [Fusarium fujikuroi]|nr:uncharacterized protein FFB20_11706 [Fusarium fujikuroi]
MSEILPLSTIDYLEEFDGS